MAVARRAELCFLDPREEGCPGIKGLDLVLSMEAAISKVCLLSNFTLSRQPGCARIGHERAIFVTRTEWTSSTIWSTTVGWKNLSCPWLGEERSKPGERSSQSTRFVKFQEKKHRAPSEKDVRVRALIVSQNVVVRYQEAFDVFKMVLPQFLWWISSVWGQLLSAVTVVYFICSTNTRLS